MWTAQAFADDGSLVDTPDLRLTIEAPAGQYPEIIQHEFEYLCQDAASNEEFMYDLIAVFSAG